MLRICIITLISLVGGSLGGYPDGSRGNNLANESPANTYGYGYSGSFSGGTPQNIPPPVFDFSGFLSNYLNSINRYHQDFIRNLQAQAEAAAAQPGGVITRGGFPLPAGGGGGADYGGGGAAYGGGDGGSFGYSFGGPYGGGFAFPGAPGVGGGSGGEGAFASGSIGPGGVQQTASVFPENPNVPNVNTRFGGSEQPDGFRSVYTSSSSFTSDVDGQPKTVKQATTTVNDNGKVTTYTAKSP